MKGEEGVRRDKRENAEGAGAEGPENRFCCRSMMSRELVLAPLTVVEGDSGKGPGRMESNST